MQKRIVALEAIMPLREELQTYLAQNRQTCNVNEGDFLLTPGQTSSKIYFIETGLVRGYYLNNGKELTTGFMKEGDFVISPVSFFRNRPSFEYLQLLEDSRLYALCRDLLFEAYERFAEFNKIGRIVTEEYYVRSELRTHYMRGQTAAEKYSTFLAEYAAIINRVPIQHIASFLGITPETLSRIRAKR
ncbi:Crp/Fnr family transcriptional regulator [Nibrella viscosa]